MHERHGKHAAKSVTWRLIATLATAVAVGCAASTGQRSLPASEAGSGGPASAGTFAGVSGADRDASVAVANRDASVASAPDAALGEASDAGMPGHTLADAGAALADGGVPGQDGGAIVPGRPGYLHTQGSQIVDSNGQAVRLTGLSWFGMETANYAPHGLWVRSLDSMLDQIAGLGYNMIRLPFCSQLFDPGSTPNGVDAVKNPALVGLTGFELMDAVVAGAGARGLRVLLDRHRPDADAQSALWYTDKYGESRWIDDWKMLAQHYKGNPTVIGFDLHNEPHGAASWGDGNMATDWRAAAERAGNAVLAINPDLLIVVEGIESYAGTGAWWGGNLRGAATYPVRLDVAQRLVYSPHDYPPSLFAQPWFSAASYPANLPSVWREAWGYLAEGGIAPIFIGELGTKYQSDPDKQWLAALASYISAHDLSFAYWCWNPNSGDTGGILQDDWMTVNADKQHVLDPLLAPLLP
jgi:endoglucanase